MLFSSNNPLRLFYLSVASFYYSFFFYHYYYYYFRFIVVFIFGFHWISCCLLGSDDEGR